MSRQARRPARGARTEDAGERQHRRLRIAIAAVVVAVGVGTTTASLIKIRPARISATIRATDVTLGSPQRQQLTIDAPLRRVTVSGARAILPNMVSGWSPEAGGGAAGLGATLAADSGGTLALESIPLPAGSRVHLAATRDARTFLVRIACTPRCAPDDGLTVVASGNVAATSSRVDGPLDFGAGRPVWFGYGEEFAQVEVELLSTPFEPAEQLAIDRVEFKRRHVSTDGERLSERPVSSVRSGAVRLEQVGGKEVNLERAQDVQFQLRTGSLRQLTLDSSVVVVEMTATVDAFRTGPELRTRLPSYLELLRSHVGLQLILGTIFLVLPVLFGLVKWWFDR